MKDQRIGNDLRVKWTLVMKGTSDPFLLEGKDLTLYLKGMYGKKKLEDFTVSENTLEWTFFGKDQKHTGVYSLILVVNEGAVGMVTTDACNFVNLVSCSCKTGGSDECGVTTESVELVSTIEYMAGGSVTVDTELSSTSMNPLANAIVAAELKKKVSAVEGMGLSSNDFTDGYKMKLDSFLVIAPTNNAEALKVAFEKYGLAERLHTPIPCFYKENSFDKAYQNAILIVESYPDGYKLNFVNISATSQFKAYDENGNEIGDAFDPEWQWSPKCKLTNGVCDSYLIQNNGYVIHLGKGELIFADEELDASSDSPISNKVVSRNFVRTFLAEYGKTSFDEILKAYKDGKVCLCMAKGEVYILTEYTEVNVFVFGAVTAYDEDSIKIKGISCRFEGSWNSYTTWLQPKLTNGINIKTINGEKILGSGNIKTPLEFVAEYDVTTAEEILTAYSQGRRCLVNLGWGIGFLCNAPSSDDPQKVALFIAFAADPLVTKSVALHVFRCSTIEGWEWFSYNLEYAEQKIKSIGNANNDKYYPTANAVRDFVKDSIPNHATIQELIGRIEALEAKLNE